MKTTDITPLDRIERFNLDREAARLQFVNRVLSAIGPMIEDYLDAHPRGGTDVLSAMAELEKVVVAYGEICLEDHRSKVTERPSTPATADERPDHQGEARLHSRLPVHHNVKPSPLYSFDADFRREVEHYVQMRREGREPDVVPLTERLYSEYLNPAVMPMLAELQAVGPETADLVGTGLGYLLSDARADWEVRV